MALTCPHCGETEPRDAAGACSWCGKGLLVDVSLSGQPPHGRELFQAARALSELGGGAPSFAAARELLLRPRGTLLSSVPRPIAEQAVAALQKAGVAAQFMSHVESRVFSVRRMLMLVALFSSAAGLAVAIAARMEPWARRAAPPKIAASTAGAPSIDVKVTEVAGPIPDAAERILPAVVSIRCGNTVGAGFFVAEDTVLTNAHVACAGPEPLNVKLNDGREVLGRVVERDDWLDVARVEVAGAGVKPLRTGDSTQLRPGDGALLVGSPSGLDFTFHEGRVSFVGRALHGVAYVQVNAAINPGNSGGPLLDSRGRAVGIITLKLLQADGIGLALPIEYAEAPTFEPHKERWEKLLARVKADDDRERERAATYTRKPYLLSAVRLGEGLGALVVQRFDGGPHAQLHLFHVRVGGEQRCQARASFGSWQVLEEAARKQPLTRDAQWLLRGDQARELFVGVAPLDFTGCPAEIESSPSTLVLRDGEEQRGQARLEPEQVRASRAAASRKVRTVSSVQSAAERRSDSDAEQSWRAAFKAAHASIARAEEAARVARAQLDAMGSPMPFNNVWRGQRQEVLRAEAQIAAAKEKLRDLERHAARAAVPLEWRH